MIIKYFKYLYEVYMLNRARKEWNSGTRLQYISSGGMIPAVIELESYMGPITWYKAKKEREYWVNTAKVKKEKIKANWNENAYYNRGANWQYLTSQTNKETK